MATNRRNPTEARRAERVYGAQLRRLADQVGRIIRDVNPTDPAQASMLNDMLRKYAETLEPWARRIAMQMIQDVNAKDMAAWRKMGAELSSGLTREILLMPQDDIFKALADVQVKLIQSIPIEAALRVNNLALEAFESGSRAESIVQAIMESGGVAKSRAMTIARTEVARTASTLTQSRAQGIGSEGYIWETSRDGDVRISHRAMRGKFVAWNDPPTLDNMQGHAGCLPNCRCWARVILP